MTHPKRKTGRSLLLMAPLFVFLGCFFVWPLVGMLSESVSDMVVSRLLPRSGEMISAWDKTSPPTPEMQTALLADLKSITDAQALGEMVRRLNSAQPGFRTLMSKTVSALDNDIFSESDLAAVDRRWANLDYWRTIADALAPITDRHLLAAVDLTRDNSGSIVQLSADEAANGAIMVRTFWIAALVTACCAMIGLPYAMIASSVDGWKRQLLLGAVLLPLWTSLLVRTAAWFILLQEKGAINEALTALHLIDRPLPLIFNRTGVVIAMTHVLLPFMVLPIYSTLITIPRNLMPAAASLGAPPLRAFSRVLFPLALRGFASGCLLVFISAIGYYITPALIGGPGEQMISSVIAFYATGSANWNMAAALGAILLIATLLLYGVYMRLSSEDPRRR